jgi:hypothetical protein
MTASKYNPCLNLATWIRLLTRPCCPASGAEKSEEVEGMEMTRSEWTHEEIAALKRKVERSLRATEREYPDIRPLPPMDEEEAKGLLHDFFSVAAERLLA